MDLTNIALVFTAPGELAAFHGTRATYFNALADVRAEYADAHRNAHHRTDQEKRDALKVFSTYLKTAQEAAADFGLSNFNMGHITGK